MYLHFSILQIICKVKGKKTGKVQSVLPKADFHGLFLTVIRIARLSKNLVLICLINVSKLKPYGLTYGFRASGCQSREVNSFPELQVCFFFLNLHLNDFVTHFWAEQ